ELSVARTPEHILHGHHYARAARDRAPNDRVRVIGAQRDPHRRSAERLWCLSAATFALTEFITDEKLMTIEHDFAVHQTFAVRRHHRIAFRTAKDSFVKIHGGLAVTNEYMRHELIFTGHRFGPPGLDFAILRPGNYK